jgi:hypothetical protein
MLQKQNLTEKKKKKKCLCGFEKRRVYHDLIEAWQDYYNLSKEQVHDKKIKRHYKHLIHTLQDKLGIAPTPFVAFEAFGFNFYKHNPELFKEDITDTMVEKCLIKMIAILEIRLPLNKRPNMVQEIIRRDYAMQKYIAETGIASKSDVSPNTPKADEFDL